jgi:hypothetical protein
MVGVATGGVGGIETAVSAATVVAVAGGGVLIASSRLQAARSSSKLTNPSESKTNIFLILISLLGDKLGWLDPGKVAPSLMNTPYSLAF